MTKPVAKFKIPLYGARSAEVYTSKDALRAACKRRNVDAGDIEHVAGRIVAGPDKDGFTVYLVGWFDGRPSTLIHELAHAAMFTLDSAGMDPRDSGGEAFCYLLQHMVNECGDLLRAAKRKSEK